MSYGRELVSFALAHGDLTQDANEDTSADAIGALARSDPLGAALWRLTSTMDAASFLAARGYLSAILRKDGQAAPTVTHAVAHSAIEEWLACQCHTCGGRRFVIVESVKTKCEPCGGTGRGRHSDDVRMAALGMGPASYSKVTAIFERAHELLVAADARVERQVSYQLERKTLKKKRK